jgi:hypothetical protein
VARRKEQPTENKEKKANWTARILPRNCLLKHVTEGEMEGRIEVTVGRGRTRCKELEEEEEDASS